MILDLILLATQATKKAAESSTILEDAWYYFLGFWFFYLLIACAYTLLFKPEAFGETKHPF